jgi:GTPase involved in cell partitioning and DNA repair
MCPGVRRGAATGEGLGNAFLSHIAAVDGIFHVCRGFEDPDVIHTEDRIDPVEDLDIIHGYASKSIFLPNHKHQVVASVCTGEHLGCMYACNWR